MIERRFKAVLGNEINKTKKLFTIRGGNYCGDAAFAVFSIAATYRRI